MALALHACGAASDYAQAQAIRCGANYIIAPCCVGKLKHAATAGADADAAVATIPSPHEGGKSRASAVTTLTHPRSALVRRLISHAEFLDVAAFADHAAELSDPIGRLRCGAPAHGPHSHRHGHAHSHNAHTPPRATARTTGAARTRGCVLVAASASSSTTARRVRKSTVGRRSRG